ncbi:hypothetical protein CAP35_15155 [Chitinophagaceae bacterium IBVUCB1]|nr:hypothetical protein CAP35_15155 [Chitinophagaceae bacterium IBVUCB1]
MIKNLLVCTITIITLSACVGNKKTTSAAQPPTQEKELTKDAQLQNNTSQQNTVETTEIRYEK